MDQEMARIWVTVNLDAAQILSLRDTAGLIATLADQAEIKAKESRRAEIGFREGAHMSDYMEQQHGTLLLLASLARGSADGLARGARILVHLLNAVDEAISLEEDH